MILYELKNLIKDLENILIKDKRFKEDYTFKHQVRTLYYKKPEVQNIYLPLVVNNTVEKECPKCSKLPKIPKLEELDIPDLSKLLKELEETRKSSESSHMTLEELIEIAHQDKTDLNDPNKLEKFMEDNKNLLNLLKVTKENLIAQLEKKDIKTKTKTK
jgi:hypothetical protein